MCALRRDPRPDCSLISSLPGSAYRTPPSSSPPYLPSSHTTTAIPTTTPPIADDEPLHAQPPQLHFTRPPTIAENSVELLSMEQQPGEIEEGDANFQSKWKGTEGAEDGEPFIFL